MSPHPPHSCVADSPSLRRSEEPSRGGRSYRVCTPLICAVPTHEEDVSLVVPAVKVRCVEQEARRPRIAH